ncbi:GIY-YIG nuclease family protein [Saccharothrix ecbatanensis]|uniref:GIY-YIG nuclease family protein n=1 Tax=Saccharothrix ecbatanensis TaxID=1105145 RepID=UPI0035E42D3B
MGAHARVAFVLNDAPWALEHELIKRETLPLNIAGNAHSPYCTALRALHDEHKTRARGLPIVP